MAEGAREEMALRPQGEAWKVASKYIVGWANEYLQEYKRQKLA